MTEKCRHYEEVEERRYLSQWENLSRAMNRFPPLEYVTEMIPRCKGTKEREVCSCEGDPSKCSFYPKKREEAKKSTKIIAKNLEFDPEKDSNTKVLYILQQHHFFITLKNGKRIDVGHWEVNKKYYSGTTNLKDLLYYHKEDDIFLDEVYAYKIATLKNKEHYIKLAKLFDEVKFDD